MRDVFLVLAHPTSNTGYHIYIYINTDMQRK